MKQRTAKILLSIFLFAALVPQQVKSELERLPALVQHFQEHRAETPEISLFQFLKLHYGENFTEHRSDHDHGDLPFKCGGHSHVFAAATMLFLPSEVDFQLKINRLPIFERQQFPPTAPFFSVETGDIWQPPKA